MLSMVDFRKVYGVGCMKHARRKAGIIANISED
jgi:hypothetical protein